MGVHYLDTLDSFRKNNIYKRILIIGAGNNALQFIDFESWNIVGIIDSNIAKRGNIIKRNNICMPIESWDDFEEHAEADSKMFDVVVITPDCYRELLERILSICSDNIPIYLYSYMYSLQWDYERNRCSNKIYKKTESSERAIPKHIHTFWFSKDPFPDKVQMCLDSWKKYCPNYEITVWNKETYQSENVFFNEAIKNKQWAFASDYARCDVIYKYGGIYLDLDVELVKNLDDMLCDKGFFCFESAKGGVDPGSGFGAACNHPIIADIRNQYANIHFENEDGSYNKVSILEQYTGVLEKKGLIRNGEYQVIDGFAIYPPAVMSPYSYRTGMTSVTMDTHGIHHWVSAWIGDEQRFYLEEKKCFFKEHEEEVGRIINYEE